MTDGAAELATRFDVSRETLERLVTYHHLLSKWNNNINLVSPATLQDAWSRHFVDSAQLWQLAPDNAKTWADLGSGGGFPGLVIAILAHQHRLALRVTLVESDGRKAAFLATVLRETGVTASVVAERIEAIPPLGADVVSARALAPLDLLLGYADRHLAERGRCLFPKGERAQAELDTARRAWRFSLQEHTSVTDPSACVLVIEGLSRV